MYKIMIILAVLMLVACEDNSMQPPMDTNPEPPVKEPAVDATMNGVVRTIASGTVAPGQEFTVTLNINLNAEQTYYLYEEVPPEGFMVMDVETDSNGRVKGIEIQNAQSTVFEYSLQAPDTPGTYTFGGEYAVEGMENPVPILGHTTINVQ